MEDPLAPGSRWDGGLQNAPDKPDAALLLGHHALDLWICLCICHNLITQEGAEDGRPAEYQASTPRTASSSLMDTVQDQAGILPAQH